MKKAEFNKRGTKMLIDTGWKEFDRQTNCISRGQSIANTQISTCIRPFSETECNGHVFRPGELMAFDLKPYLKYGIPDRIREILEDKNRKNNMLLYMFFTTPVRHLKSVPFFWVVTTSDWHHPKLIDRYVCLRFGERYTKRMSAADEILKYIVDDENEGK